MWYIHSLDPTISQSSVMNYIWNWSKGFQTSRIVLSVIRLNHCDPSQTVTILHALLSWWMVTIINNPNLEGWCLLPKHHDIKKTCSIFRHFGKLYWSFGCGCLGWQRDCLGLWRKFLYDKFGGELVIDS